jgi:spermidine/putrescine transport system substrate-binding protein
MMLRIFWLCLLCCFSINALAEEKVLNIYAWSGEIPDEAMQEFQAETGIKINFTSYDSNEMLYAKLKTNAQDYDLIEPSNYYVERMRKEQMLMPLDHQKLSHFNNLASMFQNPPYDSHSQYSIAHIWSTTGIFVNDRYFDSKQFQSWSSLLSPNLRDQILVINDAKDVFAFALLALHQTPNAANPSKIQAAYHFLLKLAPNIKIFAVDAIPSIITDEDARIGIVWNGDLNKARKDNTHLQFIFPQEGFALSADCFAIPIHAPHPDNAHRFINFLLRKEIGKMVTEQTGYATTNAAALSLMSAHPNPIIFPDPKTLARGIWLMDTPSPMVSLYQHAWEEFKLGL